MGEQALRRQQFLKELVVAGEANFAIEREFPVPKLHGRLNGFRCKSSADRDGADLRGHQISLCRKRPSAAGGPAGIVFRYNRTTDAETRLLFAFDLNCLRTEEAHHPGELEPGGP